MLKRIACLLALTLLALFTWWVLWFMGMGALTPEDELLATIGPALQSESREPAVWCLLPSWPTLQPLVQLMECWNSFNTTWYSSRQQAR